MKKDMHKKETDMTYQVPGPKLRVSIRSRLGNRHGWLNILLLFIVLEIAVLSLERAKWITPQPSLTLVLVLAMLSAGALMKVPVRGIVRHSLAALLGILAAGWQVYTLVSPVGTATRFEQFIAVLGAPSQHAGGETIYFAVFLVLLVWTTGYLATWFLLERRNAWVAVVAGAVIVLVNLSNLPDSYYYFFGIYFIAAIILVAQTRLLKQRLRRSDRGGNYPVRGLLYLMTSLAVFGILAGTVSWLVPQWRVPQLQTAIATRMLWTRNIEDSRLNFFSDVPAKQPLATSSTREDLAFGEVWHSGDRVHFTVSSPRPSYWQVHVYDTYTAGGWTSSPGGQYVLAREEAWGGTAAPAARQTVTYVVETSLKTDIILTAGTFVSSDTPLLVQAGGDDAMAISAPRLLQPGERYTVTSGVSVAGPDELMTAGKSYPQSVTDTYLRLPPDFPDVVRSLAGRITSGAKTPYARVRAIDAYISRLKYDEKIEAPPEGVDGVEYFLMEQKSGFCTYFASAMAVMLRAVDVPSRLVVGYLPGDRDEDSGLFVLKDRHYHAWPQVYFPGYGWVDIEATPSGESEVTIETPWVGESISRELQEMDEWLAWQSLYPLWGAGGSGMSATGESSYVRESRWPFADALGKALLYGIIGVFVLLVLLVPLLVYRSAFHRWLWRVMRADAAVTVYAKMCALASLVKLGPRPQQTPLEYTAGLAERFPRRAESLDTIAQAYVENRFGRRGRLGLFEEASLLKSRRDVYAVLLDRLGFFRRLLYRR